MIFFHKTTAFTNTMYVSKIRRNGFRRNGKTPYVIRLCWFHRYFLSIRSWLCRSWKKACTLWRHCCHMGTAIKYPVAAPDCHFIRLCSVLRPLQHSIGYMGDGFTGQKTQPTVSKYWRKL